MWWSQTRATRAPNGGGPLMSACRCRVALLGRERRLVRALLERAVDGREDRGEPRGLPVLLVPGLPSGELPEGVLDDLVGQVLAGEDLRRRPVALPLVLRRHVERPGLDRRLLRHDDDLDRADELPGASESVGLRGLLVVPLEVLVQCAARAARRLQEVLRRR